MEQLQKIMNEVSKHLSVALKCTFEQRFELDSNRRFPVLLFKIFASLKGDNELFR